MRPIRNSKKNCWRKFEYTHNSNLITWEDESQHGAFKYQLESLTDDLKSGPGIDRT